MNVIIVKHLQPYTAFIPWSLYAVRFADSVIRAFLLSDIPKRCKKGKRDFHHAILLKMKIKLFQVHPKAQLPYKDCTSFNMEADKNHTHLLVERDITDRVCNIVKSIKQTATYYLQKNTVILCL